MTSERKSKKQRGPARPATMSQEDARKMCADHATVPIWPHAGQALGLGKSTTYNAANAGDLPGVIRIGSKLLMGTVALAQLLGINTA